MAQPSDFTTKTGLTKKISDVPLSPYFATSNQERSAEALPSLQLETTKASIHPLAQAFLDQLGSGFQTAWR